MTTPHDKLIYLLRDSPIRVEFGPGRLARLGELARADGARRALLVTDPGIAAAGHVDRAVASLRAASIEVVLFDGARENPTTEHVDAGLSAAKLSTIDFIIALGGGSAMDCAKGINLLLSCGGRMADYRGDPPPDVLARRPPLLPMILVPTTAGTGSEAQSFALITDAVSKDKYACGDRRAHGGLRPRVAILDPELVRTCPPRVVAAAGIDAITHAVETAGCRVRTDASRELSRRAWQLLTAALEHVIRESPDPSRERERRVDPIRGHEAALADPWSDMLLGAHFAGAAIEASMLGAAHACANPLTARCGVTHGVAVGVMLPHVIRFNAGVAAGPLGPPRPARAPAATISAGAPEAPAATARVPRDASHVNPYADLDLDAERLATRIEFLLDACRIPRRLRDHSVPDPLLWALAEEAVRQWTAGFNPRPVGADELLLLYRSAW